MTSVLPSAPHAGQREVAPQKRPRHLPVVASEAARAPASPPEEYHDPSALVALAAKLERFGDWNAARRYYERTAALSYARPKERGQALARLGAHAESLDEMERLLRLALQYDPSQRRASNALSCLTPEFRQRLERDSSGVLRRVLRQPLSVQLQTISRCNATCSMCPYPSSWQSENPGTMTAQCFEHTLAILKDVPLGRVCLYLENEPFLDPSIIERLRRVRDALRYERLEISTNLSAFTEAKVQSLVEVLELAPHEVWLSWHGVSREAYHELMGLDFDKSRAKLRNYLAIAGRRLNTVVRSIVRARHPESVSLESPERVQSFFADELARAGISPAESRVRVETFAHHDRAGNVELPLALAAPTQAAPTQAAATQAVATQDPQLGRLKPYCERINNWLHVLYDGTVILCCMDYHKETASANVAAHASLESLFQSSEVRALESKALGRSASASGFICKRCTSPGG